MRYKQTRLLHDRYPRQTVTNKLDISTEAFNVQLPRFWLNAAGMRERFILCVDTLRNRLITLGFKEPKISEADLPASLAYCNKTC